MKTASSYPNPAPVIFLVFIILFMILLSICSCTVAKKYPDPSIKYKKCQTYKGKYK